MAWISVEDRLPPDRKEVWIHDINTGVLLGQHDSQYGFVDIYEMFDGRGSRDTTNVTHWQPLDRPEPPESEENEDNK